jgi:predicted transposase/invertase (TIGR01784 family)
MSNKKLIRFDWAMKTLLRDKANFDVLEGFLCALLEDDNVKILNILESETNQKDEDDKFVRVDMLIQDSQERKIYIEIQNTRETDYLESLLYSTSKIIVEHQKLSKDFSNVSKVISISILYFNLGIGNDYIYYGTTNFKGLNTGEHLKIKQREEIPNSLKPKYKMVNKEIFPEYYLITVERYKNMINKRIDEWIYIFKNNEVAQGSSSKNIDKAEQKLAEINMTEEERKRYEKYLINFIRDNDVLNTARTEGEIKGEIKGKEERTDEIAIEMIKDGETNEKIKKYTGLSDERINELRKLLKDK